MRSLFDTPPDRLVQLGKYELRGILGRGAMGIVYGGWDPVISRRVAIKTVRLPDAADSAGQEELARFRREAQAAGRLQHPNVVGLFDYGEAEDLAYIVMEFLDGQPLKDRLAAEGQPTLQTARRLMDDLLAGLAYSHEQGVVHRDIKPANIMLTAKGQAKIADFGIARIQAPGHDITQAGMMLGTPAYMSPEQWAAQAVDGRTDIYASGVLLYQLLTGERPFDGTETEIMYKVFNKAAPRPSERSATVPPGLDAVVARAMARRPEDRYPTAAEFAEAIRGALDAPAAAAGVGNGAARAEAAADDDGRDGTVIAGSARPQPLSSVRPEPPATATEQAVRIAGPLEGPHRAKIRGGTVMATARVAAAVVPLLVAGGTAYGWWLSARPAPAHECDRLAQPPRAEMGSVPAYTEGVAHDGIDAAAATAACARAMAEWPGEARFVAYAGRAADKGGDSAEAARLYRLAADQDVPHAQFELANMHLHGRGGLAANEHEAVRLHRLAAAHGHGHAREALRHLGRE